MAPSARAELELFAQAVTLEEAINGRRAALGHDPVYLARYGVPLAEAIPVRLSKPSDEGEDGDCDSGWCMT